jgi:hypothetical protein
MQKIVQKKIIAIISVLQKYPDTFTKVWLIHDLFSCILGLLKKVILALS